MANTDLNLLIALDALLAERSVTKAAHRLGLSVSAMSRTLSRLRQATGDPLLLQAGRTLVLTPHAEQLGLRLPSLTRETLAALSPPVYDFDAGTLEHCFKVRAAEGSINLLAPALLARICMAAPRVQIVFVPKQDWDAEPLRGGEADLEIGTVKTTAPELRTRLLIRDRYVGACRTGHPILSQGRLSVETYAGLEHVSTSRAAEPPHPVDVALAHLNVQRRVRLVVPTYTSAMQVVRHSDLLTVVPHSYMGNAFVPDHAAAQGLTYFDLPLPIPSFNVSSIWHPRLDKEPAHAWFRSEVLALCLAEYPDSR